MQKNIQKIRKAVFPVGGLGTRFLPATKSMPKEMLTVVDKPLIHYAVDEAREAGIEQFIFVTGRGKTAIEDYFDENYELQSTLERRGQQIVWKNIQDSMPSVGQISYTRQPEPLGLGHAVWCAKHLVENEPFVVLLADDLLSAEKNCLQQMLEAYERHGGNVVALMQVADEDTNKYGIVSYDHLTIKSAPVPIKGIVEKPQPKDAPSRMAVLGRYILQPQVFSHLDRMQKGAGDEIQLTDALAKLIETQPFHGVEFQGRRFDCGSKAGWLEANLFHALERPDMADEMRRLLQQYKVAA